MKVLIATKNQGKIEGAKQAFEEYFSEFEIEGISVSSEVSEQPINEEIYQGCKNRIKNLKKYADENKISYDMCLAIESGMQNCLGDWMITNIAIIEDKDSYQSVGTSPSFPVPNSKVEEIKEKGLSYVMDEVLGKDEQRHNQKGGIQLLTHNKITRIDLTKQAFIMALTKFINEDRWK